MSYEEQSKQLIQVGIKFIRYSSLCCMFRVREFSLPPLWYSLTLPLTYLQMMEINIKLVLIFSLQCKTTWLSTTPNPINMVPKWWNTLFTLVQDLIWFILGRVWTDHPWCFLTNLPIFIPTICISSSWSQNPLYGFKF